MTVSGCSMRFVALACVLTVAGCSTGKSVTSGVLEEGIATSTATVEKIDHETRMVTLRGAGGKAVTFRAGDNVKNLAQVNVGDRVVAQYHESLVFDVYRKGDATPGIAVSEGVGSAEQGEMPAAAGVQAVTVTSTIAAIDRETPAVTLKGPQGELTTIKVRHPEKLERVSVGDLVEITYSQAVAISVEKASP